MPLLTEVQVDTGDTAWIIVCTALVLLMTPGLAFFYAGMVRSRHVLGMIMQSFAAIAVVSVTWVVIGYSLAFDKDAGGGLVGGLGFVGLHGADIAVPGLDLSVPPFAFVTFQMMFAILTAALISGASADRMRFGAFVTFLAIWSVVVYAPVAHWAWSPGGWLARAGLLDFAGGTVVEICSGASALALVLVIGPRRGWPREMMAPHNLPLTLLGAGLLWFGWIGFNAGSALTAGQLAASAALATHLSGVGGMIGWLVLEKRVTGKATTLGGASGAVAGLVAITPAAGYLSPIPSILLGMVAGAVCLLAIRLKFRFRYDDSLDVVAVHYVGGVIGTIGVGLLAAAAVNPAVVHEGLLLGGGLAQLGRQLLGVVAVSFFAFGATYAIAWALRSTIGLRVTPDEEYEGLDSSQHAETAYELTSTSGLGRVS
ncbi:ammonium transporter [Cellulomonas soli]|uniref:Ammonium transporter n=1 Tax=Cellulomonas soli TaxID=931535 RepID=A0A512PCA0_9CELL|nr:ammonium transporter [Cellulomonas soli]NYI58418.1 Amt family ammonium transporter [Cellulomonas soli]GEP68840.1 ammonium transporter [Cellulomonas soli]